MNPRTSLAIGALGLSACAPRSLASEAPKESPISSESAEGRREAPLSLGSSDPATVEASDPEGREKVDESSEAVGDYVCPMHPEVTSKGPGDCPICGMHLEKAE